MSVKNRIKEFVKFSKITVSSFEKSISVTNGYVNSISKSIGIDKIELIIEKYPNLNIEWLLAGKGSMIRNEVVTEIAPVINQRDEILSKTKEQLEALIDAKEETITSLNEVNNLLKYKISQIEQEVKELKTQNRELSVQKGAVELADAERLAKKIGK